MVLDIIAGAVLLAFGIVSVYFTIESGEKESRFLIIFLLGIAAIIGGGWILITRITIPVLLTKAAGLILAVIGFFLVFQFPDITDYQPKGFGKAGVLLGAILLILGIYLLFFA